MSGERYPRLEINLEAISHNTRHAVKLCSEMGISVAAVVKGASGIPEISYAMANEGVAQIASSRLDQLYEARKIGVSLPLMLIRVPMISEVDEVVQIADYSLNSDVSVLKALETAAANHNKTHNVILMIEAGDLREGILDKDELIQAALFTENSPSLYLAGVGLNVGCYGSVAASVDKMEELVHSAEMIEDVIGRSLDIISGGATTSMIRVLSHDMPERVNHLRLGSILLSTGEMKRCYGVDIENYGFDVDTFTLKCEIAEARLKPTYPVGELTVDAFGNKPEYVDRGIRKKAIIDIGRVDYGNTQDLLPRDKAIEVVGASSDHTIIDIEDCEKNYKAGDIVEFDITYPSMAFLTASRDVKKVFVKKGN